MKNFMIIALSGIVGIALTACGGGSSGGGGGGEEPYVPKDVNYTQLTTTTLEAGYKINVDINHTAIGDIQGIDYYFCHWTANESYFADATGDWNGSTGYPEFDYGDVDIGTTGAHSTLQFTPIPGSGTTVEATLPQGTTFYDISQDTNETLTEGETYTLRVPNAGDGNITINTISDFNCSTLEAAPI